MTQCEDCGDDCQRRTRCPNCNKLVCRWCYHHTHNLEDYVPPHRLVPVENPEDPEEIIGWEVEY